MNGSLALLLLLGFLTMSPHSALSRFLQSYPGLVSVGVHLSTCGLLALVFWRLLPGLSWPSTLPLSSSASSSSSADGSLLLPGGDSGGGGGGGSLCAGCRGGGCLGCLGGGPVGHSPLLPPFLALG